MPKLFAFCNKAMPDNPNNKLLSILLGKSKKPDDLTR
jgi:hypothetical protein